MKDIPQGIYDTVIIGGGPAGLTAGIYASRARTDHLLIESMTIMGQAAMTEKIENYPGHTSIGGFELVNNLKEHAEEFGLVREHGTVEAVSRGKEKGVRFWKVKTGEKEYKALSVIVASGAQPKKLDIPGEKELTGKGVSYCAVCDGAFFRGKDIVVVGGGDSAVEEAIYLTRFTTKVTIVHRRERLRAIKLLREEAKANEKIEFIWNSTVEEIKGDGKVERIVLKDINSGERSEFLCEGIFVFAGWQPNTGFLKGKVKMDEKGHIVVDNAMKTSKEGIFACGDCSKKVLHQVITACGEGATAAYSVQQYVDELKGTAYK